MSDIQSRAKQNIVSDNHITRDSNFVIVYRDYSLLTLGLYDEEETKNGNLY